MDEEEFVEEYDEFDNNEGEGKKQKQAAKKHSTDSTSYAVQSQSCPEAS